MYSNQSGRHLVNRTLVLSMLLAIVCVGSVVHHQPQHTVHAADLQAATGSTVVQPLSSEQFNSQLVHNVWAPLVAAHLDKSQLGSSLTARANRLTKLMDPAQRADFITGVKAMQVKLLTGGFSQLELNQFETVLNSRGYSPAEARQLSRDPLALLTIPIKPAVDLSNIDPSSSMPAQGTVFTDAKTDRSYSYVTASTTTCHWSTTRPVLAKTWSAWAGDQLAKVTYIKDWCIRLTPPPYAPLLWNSTIVYAPRWEPPHVSFTSWCLGCEISIDWHDQYWNSYTPPNPFKCTTRCGFVSKVNFHLHQCIGLGPISQCLANVYQYWSLGLHSDGSFTYKY